MMKSMFCPKCGAGDQRADSYCKRCGDWLPDIDALARPRLFRKSTREQKIRKMRILEAISAGLSLTSAAIIISFLAGGAATQLLLLAVFCCFIVAAYQVVNFYLGYKLQQRVDRSRAEGTGEIKTGDDKRARVLSAGDGTPFVGGRSVVEGTTELLERVPRQAKQDE
jgi:membrane protein implicated in regulation of membrane protease activity